MALKPCPHCGHPISEKAELCPCCHHNPNLSPEELAQHKATEQQKRKRVFLVSGICVVVLLVAAGICTALLLPKYLAYRDACALLEERNYIAAVDAFDDMGDYRDSAEKALEARYQYILLHKTRDDSQTRYYLRQLMDASYKDVAQIEEQLYKWEVTVISCETKTGDFEKNNFSSSEPLFFYTKVHGGRSGEYLHLRYEATTSPSFYWQTQGLQNATQKGDMGSLKDGDNYWFGWGSGLNSNVIGSIAFSVYDADTNQLLKTCTVSVN